MGGKNFLDDLNPHLFPLLQLVTVEAIEQQGEKQVKNHEVPDNQGRDENGQARLRSSLNLYGQ